MPTKQELESMKLVQLSVLCQQVAESPSADSVTAEKARRLKWEWRELENLPPETAKGQQENASQKEALKKRMADFLAATL